MTVRTRSRGSFESFTVAVTNTFCEASATYENWSVSGSLYPGTVETMIDYPTPNFHAIRRAGGIVNTEAAYTRETRSNSWGGWAFKRSSGCSCTGNTLKRQHATGPRSYAGHGDYLVMADREAVITAAVTSAAAGVESPEIDGLVELAELHKSVNLVREPIKKLDDTLRKIAKSGSMKKWVKRTYGSRSIPTPDKVGSYLSDNWLKYRYGIMPMVRTIDTAVKTNWIKRRPLRQTSRGFQMHSVSATEGFTRNTDQYWTTTTSVSKSTKVSARAGVLYEPFVQVPNFGLRQGEVLPTAWELVPYSFIVDWAFNVGDYLRAITPKAGVRRLASWVVVRDDEQIYSTVGGTWKTQTCYDNETTPGGSVFHHRERWERRINQTAGLVYVPGSLESVFTDSRKVADLLALTIGRYGIVKALKGVAKL